MSSNKVYLVLLIVFGLLVAGCLQDTKEVEVFRYTNRITLADSLAAEADSAVVTLSVGNSGPIVKEFSGPLDSVLTVVFDASPGDSVTISYQLFKDSELIFEDVAGFSAGTKQTKIQVSNQIEIDPPSSSQDNVSSEDVYSESNSSGKASSQILLSSSVVPLSSSLKLSSSSVTVVISSSSLQLSSSSQVQLSSSLMSSSSRRFDTTGVEHNGALKVSGSEIRNAMGERFVLRGIDMGVLGLTDTIFWTNEVLHEYKTKWKANAIRIRFWYSGSDFAAQLAKQQAQLDRTIQMAIDHDLYVLIQWTQDNVNTLYLTECNDFFDELSKTWGNTNHLIYDLWEGNGSSNWSTVRGQNVSIINSIRANDNDNLIIVTTPVWSQKPNDCSTNPLSDNNVAYKLEMDTYESNYPIIKTAAQEAVTAGIPVINTRFSPGGWACNFSYNNSTSTEWWNFLVANNLGTIAFHGTDLDACGTLQSGASEAGNWSSSDLTEWGAFIKAKYGL